ncbi:MAG: universal stress protein [Desulfobacterales bacterium]|jgi:nucleotide-binding universal stress UspA family protein
MKILVPSAGSAADQRTADYVVNIAKKLNAQLVVLRILSKKETEIEGEQSLRQFVEIGKREKVPVDTFIRRGEIASVIIETAVEKLVDLIILGVSRGEIVAEWMNAGATEKTDIPVLLIPKWVRGAGERRRKAERESHPNLESKY